MISFEEFKKSELRIGAVRSVAGNIAFVDFGEKGFFECKAGNSEIFDGDLVVGVLENGKAMLLAAEAEDGSYALLTVEKPVKPGTPAE